MKVLTRIDFFRDCVARLTKVLDEEFAECGKLLTSSQREAGFIAFEKLEAARDAMFAFTNELDGVEYGQIKIKEEKALWQ